MVTRKREGFTLLELMTVVAMLGVLAAIALPSYSAYMRRSKASEVTTNLNSMFKAVLNYYAMERSSQGSGGGAAGRCIVDDATPSPFDPRVSKQPFVPDARFRAIGFSIPDLVFFSYGLYSVRGTLAGDCAETTPNIAVYTLYAFGDLDGDNVLSTYELAVGTDGANQLFRSPGFYVDQPDE